MSDLQYIEETADGTTTVSLDSRLLTERRYFLTEEISPDTAIEFAKVMMYFSAEPELPADIYISSPGGEINSGLAIYDMIQSYEGILNMYCIGQTSSMAAILLASGQKGRRFILPHGKVLIHEAMTRGGIGGSATSLYRAAESIMETKDLVNGLLAKHVGKTLQEVNKATCFDNIMDADEAVAFGICDKVVNSIFERRDA